MKNQQQLKKDIQTLEEALVIAQSFLEDHKPASLFHRTRPIPVTSLETIEGVFDGENMMSSEGQSYVVPPNYASKSQLVEGDLLKLTITKAGEFIYKQIHLVPRKKLIGELSSQGRQFFVMVGQKYYQVLYPSVTYFRAKIGDRVTVIIPERGECSWGALANVLPKIYDEDEDLSGLEI